MNKLKQWALGSGSFPGGLSDLGLAFCRVVIGLGMAFAHGISKVPPNEGFVGFVGELGFPLPVAFAWLAGLSEFIGGILLALGALTRPAAIAVLGTMLVAFFGAKGANFVEGEMAALYAVAALVFVFLGGGRFSVDRLFARR